jgi:IS605 OrfB family transposase
MKLIAQIKLQPSEVQAKWLKKTIEQANAACNGISEQAWKNQIFGQYQLQKLLYKSSRAKFNLSAQVIIQCIKKVADSYALDSKRQRKFKPLGSIAFDDRILTYYTERQFVTIWTVNGREKIKYVCGDQQKKLLASRQGESDLVLHKGNYYLLAVCQVSEPTPDQVESAIGVDLGIINLATDSTGENFSGNGVEKVRQRYHNLRRNLQPAGTKSAKRHLKKASKKESRFRKDTNHWIAKKLVLKAKAQKSLIGLEDLKGIRGQTTVRRKDRAKHSGWAFAQLKGFIEYKAKIAGVSVITVDPRNSSRECSECHHIAKANRRSQAFFLCVKCGHSENADLNASKNIARSAMIIYRASVNRPIAVRLKKLPTRATGTASRIPLRCGS